MGGRHQPDPGGGAFRPRAGQDCRRSDGSDPAAWPLAGGPRMPRAWNRAQKSGLHMRKGVEKPSTGCPYPRHTLTLTEFDFRLSTFNCFSHSPASRCATTLYTSGLNANPMWVAETSKSTAGSPVQHTRQSRMPSALV